MTRNEVEEYWYKTQKQLKAEIQDIKRENQKLKENQIECHCERCIFFNDRHFLPVQEYGECENDQWKRTEEPVKIHKNDYCSYGMRRD